MPRPKKGESRDTFINRCIPYVLKEGAAKKKDQAAAMCHRIYENHKKNKET